MRSVLIQSEINNREALIAELWEYGTAGIIENLDTVRAFFENDGSLLQMLNQLSCPVLEVTDETNQASLSGFFPNHDPIYAGQRFFIVSSAMNDPAPPDRKRLVIDANDAFGSGSHESTQLVIQALEKRLPPNAIVLDVGCGSGILSVVAQELGAARVFACDIHTGAVHSARKHSVKSHFFVGSIDALAPAVADVVIVNISANTIDLLTHELHRIIRSAGLLILAGFTIDRIPVKIHPDTIFQLNDWLCWLCRPEDIFSVGPQANLQPFPAQWW